MTRLRQSLEEELERARKAAVRMTRHPRRQHPCPISPLAPNRILVDDPVIVPELRAVFPLMHHRPEVGCPVELDAVFDRELSGTIALAGCGSVDIGQPFCDSESRETGSREGTGLAVNLAAVDAIAWQTRLRNFDGGTTIRAQDRGRDRSDCDRARFQIVPV